MCYICAYSQGIFYMYQVRIVPGLLWLSAIPNMNKINPFFYEILQQL